MIVFPMAMAIAVAAMMVMADADTNRANMNADDGRIGSRGHKAERKD